MEELLLLYMSYLSDENTGFYSVNSELDQLLYYTGQKRDPKMDYNGGRGKEDKNWHTGSHQLWKNWDLQLDSVFS